MYEQRALKTEQKKAVVAAKKVAKAKELTKQNKADKTLKKIEQSMLADQSKKKANASHTVGRNGHPGHGECPSHRGKSTQTQAQATTTQNGNPSQSIIASGTVPVTTATVASLVGSTTGAGGSLV